jgi:hypothetical protein
LVCKIRMILDVLSDGKWHSIEGLEEDLRLACYEVEARLVFLSEFELADIDVKEKRVKINKDFRNLAESSSI